MRMRSIALLCALVVMGGDLFAQGVQSGTIRGTVKDQQDLAVPGVTVTVSSPALQGARTATTEAQGGYVFCNLPPGDYQVKFELSGFSTVTQNTSVPPPWPDGRAERHDPAIRRGGDGERRRGNAGAHRVSRRRRQFPA